MSDGCNTGAEIIRFPFPHAAEGTVLVLTDLSKTGPVDAGLEKLAAEHRMYRDGGGCMVGSTIFENYYCGLPANCESFEAAVVAAGYEVRQLAA